ncbi:MAG TPA: hypothetical protein VGY97_02655 [Solirubrobacteraceae bacterium]|nr:hypothetical protein [Solirubrobacteraceae bacterium]
MLARALALSLAVLVFAGPNSADGAFAAGVHPLRLLRGPGACLSLWKVAGCGRAVGFTNPIAGVAMSSDGSSIYLPSENDALFGALALNKSTGRLSQPSGRAACWTGALAVTGDSNNHVGACRPVRGLSEVTRALAVSPDGRSVYVASGPRDEGFGPTQTEAVAVFARGADGSLAQLPGAAGCVASAPLQGCTVVPGMTAQDVSVARDGGHLYLGGSVLSVFARDPGTGALAKRSCLSAGPAPGCSPAPLHLSLGAPVFASNGRYAYALGEHDPNSSMVPDAQAVVALAVDPASGDLTPLSGLGGCVSGYSALGSLCALDRRFGPLAAGLVLAPRTGELYLTTSPVRYSPPAPRGTPFDVLALRLDAATGSMTAAGAACLSSVRRPGCAVDRHLGAVGAIASSPDGRRLYGVTDTDVLALSRAPATGALRRLSPAVRGCVDPVAPCSRRRQPINGPHQVLVSPDGRFAYVVSDVFGDTGTVAALALR